MKALTNKLLILCFLLLGANAVSAADRFEPRYGYGLEPHRFSSYNIAALDWRLGEPRRGGREILYRTPGSKRWQVAPGEAVAVADGWVLGTDRHRGGYGIYRWNGRGWSRMPGEAVEIGGSYERPWVVNAYGTRYVWNGHEWREEVRSRPGRGPERDRDRGRDSFRR